MNLLVSHYNSGKHYNLQQFSLLNKKQRSEAPPTINMQMFRPEIMLEHKLSLMKL